MPLSLNQKRKRKFMKAITVKPVIFHHKHVTEVISIGTLFEIITVGDRGYSTCSGLPVSSVWNDEYELIECQDIKKKI